MGTVLQYHPYDWIHMKCLKESLEFYKRDPEKYKAARKKESKLFRDTINKGRTTPRAKIEAAA